MSEVKTNDNIKVHYTGTLTDGTIFDSSENREPLAFQVGEGRLIPGFEQGVIGMKVEESKTIHIPAAEAYGPSHPERVYDVNRQHLPADLEPQVGQELVSQDPNGQQAVVKIVEVGEENVKIDANHPLAGKDLTFEIKVVEIG